jgi:hypothetical protein
VSTNDSDDEVEFDGRTLEERFLRPTLHIEVYGDYFAATLLKHVAKNVIHLNEDESAIRDPDGLACRRDVEGARSTTAL